MEKISQKQVWNEIARDWKEVRETPRKEVQEFIESCQGNLLDLGCGSGRHFIKKEGLKIYGVDFSKNMIELAKKNIGKEQEIELKEMQNEEIPYPDKFFDNIICIAVLHCVETKEKREKLLQEIKRVLKDNGKAFIQVWSKKHNRVKNKGKEAFIPWTIKEKKFERYYYIYDLEELKEELEKTGFNVLNIYEDMNINAIISNK